MQISSREIYVFFRAGKLAIFEAYYLSSLSPYLMAQSYCVAAAPRVQILFFYRGEFEPRRPEHQMPMPKSALFNLEHFASLI